MIYWANKAAEGFPDVANACVVALKDDAASHDNYCDIVLGLLRVGLDAYRPSRDIFDRSCQPSHREGRPL